MSYDVSLRDMDVLDANCTWNVYPMFATAVGDGPDQGAILMTDLSTRIASAECGSRELDAEIAALFDWVFETRIPEFKEPRWWPPESGRSYSYAKANPPAFTTSLDAALALVERVSGAKEALLLLADVIGDPNDDLITPSDLPRLLCAALLSAKGHAK